MTLEHYPGMAEAEIARHVEDAQARWPLLGVTIASTATAAWCPATNIVLVVTAASHRGDAFAAAEFLMDYLKTKAPFWKQEERPQGTAWVAEPRIPTTSPPGAGKSRRDGTRRSETLLPPPPKAGREKQAVDP